MSAAFWWPFHSNKNPTACRVAPPPDAKLITDCYFAQKPVLTAGNADGTHIFANVLKLLSRVALPEATGKVHRPEPQGTNTSFLAMPQKDL